MQKANRNPLLDLAAILHAHVNLEMLAIAGQYVAVHWRL